MTAGAFLPATIYKNKLLFLFGKESRNDETRGFSDFGGGIEKGENILEGALREFSEETSGFLGNKEDVRKMVKKNGGYLTFVNCGGLYTTFLINMDYEQSLLNHFNNFHSLLNKTIKNNKNWIKNFRKTKIFEKEKMEWMTKKQIFSRIREFRPFYREIIKNILKNEKEIVAFLKNKQSKNRTKKRKTI